MIPGVVLLVLAAQEPPNVSRSPRLTSEDPYVTRDERGRAIAVWEETRKLDQYAYEHTLMTSTFGKERWSDPEIVHRGSQRHFHARLFPGTPPAATWVAPNKWYGPASFFVATRADAGWKVERFLDGAIRLDVPYMASCVSVLRDAAGAFHLVYTGPKDRFELYTATIRDKASEPRRLAGAEGESCHSPSMAAIRGGMAVAWVQGDPKAGDALFFATAEADRFTEPVRLRTEERYAFCPRLASGGDSLVLVWGERDAFGYPARSKHYLSTIRGRELDARVEFPYKPASLEGDRLTLNVSVDAGGKVHAVGYRRLSGILGAEREFAHATWDGSRWRVEGIRRDKRPSSFPISLPLFSLGLDGLCEVLWSEAKGIPSGLPEIYHLTTP